MTDRPAVTLLPQSVTGPLRVRVTGPASGPPVVLLHGFLADGRQWRDLVLRVDRLRGVAHRWILPDLPGHGASVTAFPEPPTWAALAELLHATLHRVTPLPAPVGGYSMGGRVAAVLADLRPQAVQTLWLESPQPPLEPKDVPARLAVDAVRGREAAADLVAFVDAWQTLPLFASQRALPRAVLHRQRRLRLAQDGTGLARSLAHFGTATMPALHALSMPVHYLAGGLDTGVVARLPVWAAHTHAWSLEVVPNAGHAVHLDAPDAAARSLATWLDARSTT